MYRKHAYRKKIGEADVMTHWFRQQELVTKLYANTLNHSVANRSWLLPDTIRPFNR